MGSMEALKMSRGKTIPPTRKHSRSSPSGRSELIVRKKDEKQSAKRRTVLDNHFYRTDRKFAELETLASELRRTKAEFADGYPKLIKFYEALAWDYASDTEKNHLATVEAWRRARPRSTPAIVASAMTDFTYAWKARG